MNNKCDGCKFYCNGRCFGEKDAPYVEYADCQGENNRHDTISNERVKEIIDYIKELEERQKGKPKDKWVEFAHFVAGSIFDDEVEDDKDFFIEVACRKLVELGIVELVDGNYQYDYGEEE